MLIEDSPDRRTWAAVAWPQIDGIDATDVRERLSDDIGLFRSMLERLLDEFTGLAMPTVHEDLAALSTHKARMHKLKGSAGILGAKSIQQLAAEAEKACAAGQTDRARQFTVQLALQLQQLSQSAAPTLGEARAHAENTISRTDEKLKPQLLVDLIQLLRLQSLSALERFSSLSPQLRRLLGTASYEAVLKQINSLEFNAAADALETYQP